MVHDKAACRSFQALGIEHRLTRPRRPQTNGMVERFNGRIADLLRTHHFRSRDDLEQTLHRYVTLYNHHLPQQALNAQTPAQALQTWYTSQPELFHRRPANQAGRDSYIPVLLRAKESPDGQRWIRSVVVEGYTDERKLPALGYK